MRRLPVSVLFFCSLAWAGPGTASCLDSSRPATCFALAEKAGKAQEFAKMGRDKWSSVAHLLIENPPPAWVHVHDGWLINTYRGAIHPPNKRRATPPIDVTAIAQDWSIYMETVYQHHLSGRLTYDIYACQFDCARHRSGFEWAEENDVTDYADCRNDDRSFMEGCYVRVTRALGMVLPH